jgi:hypothetical protein
VRLTYVHLQSATISQGLPRHWEDLTRIDRTGHTAAWGGRRMSRKGQLWRGDLAEHIEEHLAGRLSAEDLVDWAIDHPFFEDRTDLDEADQRVIGSALGFVLQIAEPNDTRTTPAQLRDVVEALWLRRPLPSNTD